MNRKVVYTIGYASCSFPLLRSSNHILISSWPLSPKSYFFVWDVLRISQSAKGLIVHGMRGGLLCHEGQYHPCSAARESWLTHVIGGSKLCKDLIAENTHMLHLDYISASPRDVRDRKPRYPRSCPTTLVPHTTQQY